MNSLRRYVKLSEPCLKVGPALMSRPVPPAAEDGDRIINFVSIEVECPVPSIGAEIPVEWLAQSIRGLRSCLEAATRLCEEVSDRQRYRISPIEQDLSPNISDYGRTRDLSGCVIAFASLYKRLVAVDQQRAREEFAAWPSDECTAFARLRFWASGKPEIATPDAFAQVVLGLTDNVFWGSHHQRDLLITLAKRWNEIAAKIRTDIETRILAGPSRYEGEDEDSYREHVAWSVLDRLQWLKTHGCEFSFDVESEIANRKPNAPNWKPEYAKRAAESRETRSGSVATDTEHSALVREPISSILSKARELSGRSDTDNFRENDPFAGLCSEHPRRAYLALAKAARRHEYPPWAWTTFLNCDSRENDPPAFSAVVATRLCRATDEVLSELLYLTACWLQKVSKAISTAFPEVFDRIVQRLIDVIKTSTEIASSVVIGSSRGPDWVMEANSSPVGQLIRAVFDDARFQNVAAIQVGLGPIEKCLALSGDARRHAIALASHHLGWLHANAADWTVQKMLAILDGDDTEDREALWAGFFWNPQISSSALYLRIKDGLLAVAKDGARSREGHVQSLASLLLTGWISSSGNSELRWVDSSELRDVLLHGGDKLRSHVLWQFKSELRNENDDQREKWQRWTCEFFEEAWPRQRSVKTPEMTARIVDVLLAHSESFRMSIDVVSPLLTTLHGATRLHIHLGSEMKDLIAAHPERFLHLLHIVLPEDVHYWPYGIGDALEMISTADASLLADPRLRDLRRRWDAR